MNRRHKMHKGEIIFHIMVPVFLICLVMALGYYVMVLVRAIILHQ